MALSIRQYDDDEKQAIKVVPPLLRKEVKTTIRHHGDYIMGYMLNTGFAEDVRAWHAKHPHTHLHFFWDKTDAPEELKVDDTLTFHRLDDVKFLRMMAGCRAYATTAGFELSLIHISEPTRLGMISYAVFCLGLAVAMAPVSYTHLTLPTKRIV